MTKLNLDLMIDLYRRFAPDLAQAGLEQRQFLAASTGRVQPQLDDIESELTYLLIRESRPAEVVELGSLHGWSTSWILRALRDNGSGRLISFDLLDNAASNIPAELADQRWRFVQGDVRTALDIIPKHAAYVFIDASHSAKFASWYLDELFPRLEPGTIISVHDVFHFPFTLPFHEGRIVKRWLSSQGASYFTPARARSPRSYRTLTALRSKLKLEAIRGPGDNPIIYFELPKANFDLT